MLSSSNLKTTTKNKLKEGEGGVGEGIITLFKLHNDTTRNASDIHQTEMVLKLEEKIYTDEVVCHHLLLQDLLMSY